MCSVTPSLIMAYFSNSLFATGKSQNMKQAFNKPNKHQLHYVAVSCHRCFSLVCFKALNIRCFEYVEGDVQKVFSKLLPASILGTFREYKLV